MFPAMRSYRIHQNDTPLSALRLDDVDVPEPAPGEIRIAVEAAGLGLPDVFMCKGTYAFKPQLPFTPGQEVSGRVVARGDGATMTIGTRVMSVTSFFRGHGGFAEQALALDAASYPVPDEMSASEAASFVIPFQTAWIGLVTRAKIKPDETLAVLGAAGGTGSAAIQLGRALGARVIAIAGGSKKTAACTAPGADEVIDHQREDIAQRVLALTDGRGADVIYDPVAGPALAAAVHCIASEGRILAIGFASGSWTDASTARLVGRNAALLGVYVGAYGKPFTSEMHEKLLALWREKKIRSLVTREVDFDSLPQALEDLAERRSTGKIVATLA